MPRVTTTLQVFVASPSDVSHERELLDGVVSELNAIWSRTTGINMELLRWETHVRPAFGSDPQAVINQQIGDDYDVFIGILWSRFGTPTPRALSGTQEEFDRAVARKKGPNPPEVMIYFKDAPLSPSKIDSAQLALVHHFKASISGLGGVYSVFEDDADFQVSLRSHLSAIAQGFRKSAPTHVAVTPEASEVDSAIVDDDLGYFDYVELFEERTADLVAAMNSINDATVRVGQQISSRTDEMAQLRESNPTTSAVKRAVRHAAEDMHSYAKVLKQSLPILASGREKGLDALSKAIMLQQDFSEDRSGLSALSDGIAVMLRSIRPSRTALMQFRDTVMGLPKMTSELNRAKRSVAEQLGVMIQEIDKLIATAENIADSVTKILEAR